MRVLNTAEAPFYSNVFNFQLVEALLSHPEISTVMPSTGLLFSASVNAEVLHVQWPEHLQPGRRQEGDWRLLERALKRWRERARIVMTVHNALPHRWSEAEGRRLYQLFYEHCDALVHLGHATITDPLIAAVGARHRLEHTVIPHGNYSVLERFVPGNMAAADIRTSWGFSTREKLVLAVGALRDRRELRLVERLVSAAERCGAHVVVVGAVPYPRRDVRHWVAHFNFRRAGVHYVGREVSPADLAQLVAASDLVAIPRLAPMNSGTVPLGFTFGRVVVGADCGVVGETLRQYGNPVFDSHDEHSIERAVREGIAAATNGLGEANRRVAHAEWDWASLAQDYVRVFRGH